MIPEHPKLNCWISSIRLGSVVEIIMAALDVAALDVADISSAGRQKLVALLEGRESRNNDDNGFPEHDLDIIDVHIDLPKKVQTELDDTHHSESNGVHDSPMLEECLEDQRTEDNLALKKTKVQKIKFATTLVARKADLAVDEKRMRWRRLRLPARVFAVK